MVDWRFARADPDRAPGVVTAHNHVGIEARRRAAPPARGRPERRPGARRAAGGRFIHSYPQVSPYPQPTHMLGITG